METVVLEILCATAIYAVALAVSCTESAKLPQKDYDSVAIAKQMASLVETTSMNNTVGTALHLMTRIRFQTATFSVDGDGVSVPNLSTRDTDILIAALMRAILYNSTGIIEIKHC